jgi:hypothetical protein
MQKPTFALTLNDLALLRGYLQGVDLKTLGERCVGSGVDLRVVKSRLDDVMSAVRAIARYQGQLSYGRILTTRIALSAQGNTAPSESLDEFQRRVDPSAVYRESELIDLYKQSLGGDSEGPSALRRQRRNARLIEKQQEAMRWLESQERRQPSTSDGVAMWLAPKYADRLIDRADVTTFAALIEFIAREGYLWHRRVPGLGEVGARYVMKWLDDNTSWTDALPLTSRSPKRQIDYQSLMQARMPALGIVPMDKLTIPPELNGAHGRYRAAGNSNDGETDLGLIISWLAQRAGSPNTVRAYMRDAERLLLYCVIHRGIPISSLSQEDYAHFLEEFCSNPPPDWRARRGTERYSEAWRPFEGGLSASSIQSVKRNCDSLLAFMTAHGYLSRMRSAPASCTADFEEWLRLRLDEGTLSEDTTVAGLMNLIG